MRYKKMLLNVFIIIVVSVFAFIFFVWIYPALVTQFEKRQDDSIQERASKVMEEELTTEPPPPTHSPSPSFPPSPSPSPSPSTVPSDSDSPMEEENETEKEETEKKKKKEETDNISTPPPTLSTKISALRKEFKNNDIVGYLTVDGTVIAYPVVQASDNEYYLRRDLYGKTNKAGTLFMDYENNITSFDENTIIYGHNMKNGTMFHDLRYYQDESFFENHPYIDLMTPEGETRWEIFAFYQASTEFYYIQTQFENKLLYQKFLKQIKEKSLYETGVSVDYKDKILTLSTCANEGGDQRYALHAKLLP